MYSQQNFTMSKVEALNTSKVQKFYESKRDRKMMSLSMLSSRRKDNNFD